MFKLPPLLCLLLIVSACGSPRRDIGQHAPLECVPFARALSGVKLRGNAADWWWRANGRYARGNVPETGAVMVLSRTPRLPQGHLSVVSRVMSRREILVTQANWVHHYVTTDGLAVDVSPDGDWSAVRVWWPPADRLGATVYPVSGFIYPAAPLSHDRLVRSVPGAIRLAAAE